MTLSLYNVYGNSTLLALNGTPLNSINALLAQPLISSYQYITEQHVPLNKSYLFIYIISPFILYKLSIYIIHVQSPQIKAKLLISTMHLWNMQ